MELLLAATVELDPFFELRLGLMFELVIVFVEDPLVVVATPFVFVILCIPSLQLPIQPLPLPMLLPPLSLMLSEDVEKLAWLKRLSI